MVAANTAATTGSTASRTATAVATRAAAAANGIYTTTLRVANMATLGMAGSLGMLYSALGPVIAALTAILTPIYIFKKLVEGTRTFQDFQAQLEVVTGSAVKATQAYSALVDYAIRTPFGLKQATDGFVKLVNFGLDPSERAMRALGNIASGTAKEFEQMVQAVAMATVNNFVRLKQFGILGRKVGDEVIFTFQGVTTRVKAEAKSIQEYIIGLGETTFGTAMEKRMLSLSGTISNLSDAWSLFWQEVAKLGPDNILTQSFKSIEMVLKELTTQMASGQFAADMDAFMIKWRTVGEIVKGTVDFLKTTVSEGIVYIGELLQMTGIDYAFVWENLPIVVEAAIRHAVNKVQYWYEMSKISIQNFVSDFYTAWDQVNGYIGVFIDVFKKAWDAVESVVTPVMDYITNRWEILTDKVSTVATAIKIIWDAIYGYISSVIDGIVSYFSAKFDEIVGIAKVTGAAIASAMNLQGFTADFERGLKTVSEKAAAALEKSTARVKAGAVVIQKALDDVTTKSNERYAAADAASAAQAAQAAATLTASTTVVNEAYDKHLQEYAAAKARAEEIRRQYDADISDQRSGGKDRLAEFEKTGNGSSFLDELNKGKTSSGGGGRGGRDNDDQRQLDQRLKLVEDGMRAENMVVSDAYAERRRLIMDSELLSIQEKEAFALAALSNSFITEEQAVVDSYNRRRDIILSATELTESAKTELLTKLTKSREEALAAIEEETQATRVQAASQFFGNLEAIGKAFGKKGVMLAKAAAIANITINTAEAAMKAYKDGGAYLGPAYAAAAIAAGAVQIANVASTQYSGAYAHGGMIPAGRTGLVGEAGPEIVRGPAVVTSAATTRTSHGQEGGSTTVTINVYNQPGQEIETRERTGPDGEKELDLIIKRVEAKLTNDATNGGGRFVPELQRRFKLSRA